MKQETYPVDWVDGCQSRIETVKDNYFTRWRYRRSARVSQSGPPKILPGMDENSIVRYAEGRSAKQRELYRTAYTKAGVSLPTRLLIDMKLEGALVFDSVMHAERNKEVHVTLQYH
jgi:hypothetical protein